jgi:lipid A 3-O-deacylase
MRLFSITVLLLFLFSCSLDGRKVKNKVLPPAGVKTMVEEGKKKPAVGSRQSAIRSRQSAVGSQQPAVSKKKKKKKTIKPVTVVMVTHYNADSVRISNIEKLRSSGIKMDLSEPMNQDILWEKGGDTLFTSAVTLSRDRVLKIGFDNDIFDYTDQFYTNGIRIEYVAPSISDNPVKHILLPYWGKAKNYYGLSVVQNLYTPSTTKVDGILYGDRPYAAYLYFGSFKVTNDEAHHFRQTSELDLGVIGKPSLGGAVQDLFHKYVPYNNEPRGWEYQVSTDAVISYSVSLLKGVVNTEHLQLMLTANGVIGTLYDNFAGGARLRIGWFNDYFSDLGIQKKRDLRASRKRVTQYYFTVGGEARFVAYDATLEGGMVNHNSPYTIPAASISNLVTQSSFGFTVTYGALGLELEQIVLSPEFSHKWWHAWGHIGLFFAL